MTQRELIKVLMDNNLILKTKVYEDKLDNIIENITYNSKECTKSCAFFAKGRNFKDEYIYEAINNGAHIVVSANEYVLDNVGFIQVKDIRMAMAIVANEFFGRPYKNLNIIGVTGTKGKTTTTYFIKNILDEQENGEKTALISSVKTFTSKRCEESHLTTPEAIDLQRYFSEAVESNLKYVAMEVSSQACKYERIHDLNFGVGVFLNISEDHISEAEHPNFNDYLNSKLKFIKCCETVVINRETQYYDAVVLAAKNAKKIVTFGSDKFKDSCDYYVDNIQKNEDGIVFRVNAKDYTHQFKINMHGRFNVENAMASIVVAHLLGVSDEAIEKGLATTRVQGRMSVFKKSGITVIVDYAHNKLSYSKLYESLKLDYPGARIISLGGSAGGKAYNRRKDFGEIVGKNSDYIYLTAEDPQFESVKAICLDMANYIDCPYEIIEDRKQAIEKAIGQAKTGDVIVLLAKGEEKYQKVRGKLAEYESDTAIVKRLLKLSE